MERRKWKMYPQCSEPEASGRVRRAIQMALLLNFHALRLQRRERLEFTPHPQKNIMFPLPAYRKQASCGD